MSIHPQSFVSFVRTFSLNACPATTFKTYFHSAVQLSYLLLGHPQTKQQHFKTSFPQQFLIFHDDNPTRTNSNSNLLSLSSSAFIEPSLLKATAFLTFFPSTVHHSYFVSERPMNKRHQHILSSLGSSTFMTFIQTYFPSAVSYFHEDNPARTNSNSNLLSLNSSSFIEPSSLKATTFLTFFPSTVHHSYFVLERPLNKRHQHILSSLSSSTFMTFIKTSSLTATLIQTYFPSLVHQSYLSSEHPRSDQPHSTLSFAHHQHRLLNSFPGHLIITMFCQHILAQSNSNTHFLSLISSLSLSNLPTHSHSNEQQSKLSIILSQTLSFFPFIKT